jgi:neuronal PAS domain-containing protein 1/3
MNKNGGYTWIQTCATVVCSVKNADEQNIICVNYIISGKENANMILDQCQLGIVKREPMIFSKSDNDPKSPDTSGDNSRGAHDSKGTVGDGKSMMVGSMSRALENSSNCGNKANERQNYDEESLGGSSGKRGRKRKMKTENKDAELPPPGNTTPLSMNHSENHPDITVKELESVMSKHLPKTSLDSGSATDFSADSLLRQHSDITQHSSSNFSHQTGNTMPATALLRQLYANRESVIRATTRPANYMYADTSQQQSLPTPPNDSYDSQYLLNTRKSGEAFGNLVSSYSAYSSMEYNTAMTPPSSVSPRDLTNHKSSGSYSNEYSNLSSNDARSQYQGDTHNSSLPHLPLKPQPYAIHHQMDATYSIDHQSQYFPYHSGFHLYHKNIYTPP